MALGHLFSLQIAVGLVASYVYVYILVKPGVGNRQKVRVFIIQ